LVRGDSCQNLNDSCQVKKKNRKFDRDVKKQNRSQKHDDCHRLSNFTRMTAAVKNNILFDIEK